MPINRSIPGQLREEEMLAIEAVATLVPAHGHVVELGALLGRSSWIWAQSVAPSVTVHCCDPWELGAGGNFATLAAANSQEFSLRQFLTNVADCPNIRPHQGFSPTDFRHWSTPIDLYFDDAVHTDPVLSRNLAFWSAHLKPDGIICGHDYIDKFPDVRHGAERLAARLDRRLQVIGSFWLLLPARLWASSDPAICRSLALLTALEQTPRPSLSVPLPVPRPAEPALTASKQAVAAIASLAYALSIEGVPHAIVVPLGHDLVLRGSLANTSGCDWPVTLAEDRCLEIGAELYCGSDRRKIAAARWQVAGQVAGQTLRAGQSVAFELRLSTAAGAIGTASCMIDALYRHVTWFAPRGGPAASLPLQIVAAA